MATSWQQIYEGETDINSPISQTLMDKIRLNLDYLKDREFDADFLHNAHDAGSPGATAYDVTISAATVRDWRDRFVRVYGMLYTGGYSFVNQWNPGGPYDSQIGSPYQPFPINFVYSAPIDGWIYTRMGGASRTTNPFITVGFVTPFGASFYFWIDTSGNLKLGLSTAASGGSRSLAWNLQIYFSAHTGTYLTP